MTTIQAYTAHRAGTFTERCAARLGLAAALVLLRLPFRYTVRVVRLARCAGRRPLARGRAEELVSAVRYVGRRWPVRIACMESSLGAVLAAAILRRRLTWCLGARFTPPPVEYHAWAEIPVHGPVGEYTTGGWHHHTALQI
ncbi:lasso peptide biosynthesis B2 protein [Streptomyces avicenniae]|uniref:lasso peptide biosynthesis B2 protein n=1 Tax=Streptomyces avicenniae TaxID=500153 RepID=UPI000AF026FB|nr:lasso peptide biosynthesis B2 protein [Streptomyces avicenniae]